MAIFNSYVKLPEGILPPESTSPLENALDSTSEAI
jgi:hypothetical protein